MNDSFKEGDVVIVISSQAGSVVQIKVKEVWVLLRNGDIWTGPMHQVRFPQDKADLESCPLNVERIEPKIVIRNSRED